MEAGGDAFGRVPHAEVTAMMRRAAGGVQRRAARTPVAPGDQVWSIDMASEVDANADAWLVDVSARPSTSRAPLSARTENGTHGARAPAPRDSAVNKGHERPLRANAMDRLESWLGLRAAPAPGAPAARPPAAHAKTHARASRSSGSIDVLVHPVSPHDTLEGVALRYGADAHIVRRSNRLWPGDPVQMRDHVYVPVDACRLKPANADIHAAQRLPDGSLRRAQGGAGEADSGGTQRAPVSVASVEEDELQFFSRASGAAPRPRVSALHGDPGESGVDDLLRWDREQRNGPARAPKRDPLVPSPPAPPAAYAPDKAREQGEWRPNVWSFGAPRRTPRNGDASPSPAPTAGVQAPEPPLRQRAAASAAPERRPSPAPLIDLAESPDRHDSPLSRLDDLLRGPVTNPGAASNWVRPIHWGETLPVPPGAPPPAQQPTSARHMFQLFSDVVQGKVQVEDAMDAAMHELRAVTMGGDGGRGPERSGGGQRSGGSARRGR
ncbi:hypothetical protein MSPP1_003195 [Malassezia sp. CBS 17886]|nr:hypothetical protein MSPP1_003195 [Malassezia sp. CBS 17886]